MSCSDCILYQMFQKLPSKQMFQKLPSYGSGTHSSFTWQFCSSAVSLSLSLERWFSKGVPFNISFMSLGKCRSLGPVLDLLNQKGCGRAQQCVFTVLCVILMYVKVCEPLVHRKGPRSISDYDSFKALFTLYF